MVKKIYIGNLPLEVNESHIGELFEQYGEIHSIHLVKDRDTGQSKGFGFVEMNDDSAQKAINFLNGAELAGKKLTVDVAKDRRGGGSNRPRGGGGSKFGRRNSVPRSKSRKN